MGLFLNSCISLYSYIKPQLCYVKQIKHISCISLYSYIKPQHILQRQRNVLVVYLYIPTSNHNIFIDGYYVFMLYIFIFLHQTTTMEANTKFLQGCISLYSYIKPQLFGYDPKDSTSCISLYSYIKPQLKKELLKIVNKYNSL